MSSPSTQDVLSSVIEGALPHGMSSRVSDSIARAVIDSEVLADDAEVLSHPRVIIRTEELDELPEYGSVILNVAGQAFIANGWDEGYDDGLHSYDQHIIWTGRDGVECSSDDIALPATLLHKGDERA